MEGKPKQKKSWIGWFHQIFQRGVSKPLNSRIQISITQVKFSTWKHSLNFLKLSSYPRLKNTAVCCIFAQAEKQSKKLSGISRVSSHENCFNWWRVIKSKQAWNVNWHGFWTHCVLKFAYYLYSIQAVAWSWWLIINCFNQPCLIDYTTT